MIKKPSMEGLLKTCKLVDILYSKQPTEELFKSNKQGVFMKYVYDLLGRLVMAVLVSTAFVKLSFITIKTFGQDYDKIVTLSNLVLPVGQGIFVVLSLVMLYQFIKPFLFKKSKRIVLINDFNKIEESILRIGKLPKTSHLKLLKKETHNQLVKKVTKSTKKRLTKLRKFNKATKRMEEV